MKITFLHLKDLPPLTLFLFVLLASACGQSPPVFLTQPQGMIVSSGSTVTLAVEVEGDEPMGFRWRRKAITLLPLETNRTLVISNLRTGGVYTVVVTNAYGQRLSAKASEKSVSAESWSTPAVWWQATANQPLNSGVARLAHFFP
jgi:hypothetical protein